MFFMRGVLMAILNKSNIDPVKLNTITGPLQYPIHSQSYSRFIMLDACDIYGFKALLLEFL